MTPLQLNPPLWLETVKGVGLAHFVTWSSIEHSMYWTVFLESGEIWNVPNEEVRAPKNWTGERRAPKLPTPVAHGWQVEGQPDPARPPASYGYCGDCTSRAACSRIGCVRNRDIGAPCVCGNVRVRCCSAS